MTNDVEHPPRRTRGPLAAPREAAIVTATASIAAVLAGLMGAGCGAGDEGSSSGTQLVAGRDIANVFFWNQDVIGYSRQTQDPSQPEPQDLWLWNVPMAAPSVAISGIDWAPPAWWPSFFAGSLLLTGNWIYDLDSQMLSDWNAVDMGLVSNSPNQVIAVRRDAGAIATTLPGMSGKIAAGYPPNFTTYMPVADDASQIVGVTFVGQDLVVAVSSTATTAPAAASAADTATATTLAPAKTSVYRIALQSGNVTNLMTDSAGIDGAKVLGSCGKIGYQPCALFTVAGCFDSDPPCPGQSSPPCFLFFVGDGGSSTTPPTSIPFAYDVATGAMSRLEGMNPTHFDISGDQHRVVWYTTDTVAGGMVSQAHEMDLCSRVATVCPAKPANSYPDQTIWAPDDSGFVTYPYGGQMAVARYADQSCSVVPQTMTNPVFELQYAPANDRLMWIAQDATATDAVWLSDVTGAGATSIATGALAGARFSPDGTRLYMARTTAFSVSLGWLDLTVDPPTEHIVANDYGGSSRVADRRALLIDHWNTQDAIGDLVLADVVTGARQVLGQAVTTFSVWGSIDDKGTEVAYTVRGRVASGRDGLWLTTLPPP